MNRPGIQRHFSGVEKVKVMLCRKGPNRVLNGIGETWIFRDRGQGGLGVG